MPIEQEFSWLRYHVSTFALCSVSYDSFFRVYDSDGQFLLIEASDYVPSWLNGEVASNRVSNFYWLYPGLISYIFRFSSSVVQYASFQNILRLVLNSSPTHCWNSCWWTILAVCLVFYERKTSWTVSWRQILYKDQFRSESRLIRIVCLLCDIVSIACFRLISWLQQMKSARLFYQWLSTPLLRLKSVRWGSFYITVHSLISFDHLDR